MHYELEILCVLAILDYDAGNIESVRLALEHVGGRPEFVRDAASAERAGRIVFPGVGSAAQCMRNLRTRGFDRVLKTALERGTPVLAICIGMQLLFDSSEEDGGIEALGILPGRVRLFRPADPAMKVPHMGWNHVEMLERHPLLPDALPGGDYYFVHSYYVEPAWSDARVANGGRDGGVGTVYGRSGYVGMDFAVMAGKGSLFAAQFHPEKSGDAGLDILRRFLDWDGRPC